MDTVGFFLKIAGGEDNAREVLAMSSLNLPLEQFCALLAAQDTTEDREN